MLSPGRIGSVGDGIGCPVMKSGNKGNFAVWYVLRFNAQFVLELANGGMFNARKVGIGIGCNVDFIGCHAMEGMGATGIGPDTGKGNFGGCSLR